MCGNIVCIAAILLGIDARWPSLPGGGVEYIIQIEPHVLDRLKSGAVEAIESDVPPYVSDVRAYRITVGTERLAKDAPAADVGLPIVVGVDADWTPLPEGGVQCLLWIDRSAFEELGKPGRAIQGDVPSGVKNIRSYKITAGTKPPPPDPRTFQPDPVSKPIPAEPAVHVEQVTQQPKAQQPPATDSKPAGGEEPQPKGPAKPWWPLTLALFGLFASLGGNLFLFWVARDSRKRYRALVQRLGDAATQ